MVRIRFNQKLRFLCIAVPLAAAWACNVLYCCTPIRGTCMVAFRNIILPAGLLGSLYKKPVQVCLVHFGGQLNVLTT